MAPVVGPSASVSGPTAGPLYPRHSQVAAISVTMPATTATMGRALVRVFSSPAREDMIVDTAMSLFGASQASETQSLSDILETGWQWFPGIPLIYQGKAIDPSARMAPNPMSATVFRRLWR